MSHHNRQPTAARPNESNATGTPPVEIDETPRTQHAHVDETRVIAHMLKGLAGDGRVMIDVGAHHGMTAALFHDLGWTVHCFEPDAANREHLKRRFKGAKRIIIDPRAVSDQPQRGAAFFTSEESTGISALHAFRETHEETQQVDVTTIADIVAANSISSIDFLKIDVEGYDFAVLKGVPWDTIRPGVIECEFEDAKTVKFGHSADDLAAFLNDKGYSVYVSEWHPIIRYGIRHDWRCVYPYSEQKLHSSAWGNLLAFKNDPGVDAVNEAFRALMSVHDGGTAGTPNHGPEPGGKRPFYAAFGEVVRTRAPRLFGLLQHSRRAAASLWKRSG